MINKNVIIIYSVGLIVGIVISILAYNLYSVPLEKEYVIKEVDKIKFVNHDEVWDYMNNTYGGVNGFHSTMGFYCVSTLNRLQKQIEKTDLHESCHDVVYKSKEHFCGVD